MTIHQHKFFASSQLSVIFGDVTGMEVVSMVGRTSRLSSGTSLASPEKNVVKCPISAKVPLYSPPHMTVKVPGE